jgi:hypothetical protein
MQLQFSSISNKTGLGGPTLAFVRHQNTTLFKKQYGSIVKAHLSQ